MNSLKLSKRVIGIALSVLFVNAALADATSDARIQAYKANKLIPQNVVLPTSTGAADSDEVVVFNKSALSWKSDNALSVSYAPLLDKYGDMTIDELRAAMGPSGTFDDSIWVWSEDGWLKNITPEQQEIREYLSLVGNNRLQSDKLTSNAALSYLQEQFDLIMSLYHTGEQCFAFPCEGLDFTGKDLGYRDLSKCTGITGEQILSASWITLADLPAITFTGNESFAGKSLSSVDLSKCTGITAAQILSADNIIGTKLPAITFSGNESFAGTSLSGTNLSKCTGITATQILSTEITNATLPAISFSGNESFAGKSLVGTDLSKCTGITGAQIMSASRISNATLPEIIFDGNESFEGKDLKYTNLSNCTGITGNQIGSASYIDNMNITSAQYNDWKSTLQTKFKNKYVYVDGVRTKIQ